MTNYGRSLLQAQAGSSLYTESMTSCKTCCSFTISCKNSSGTTVGTYTTQSCYNPTTYPATCNPCSDPGTLTVQCNNSFPSQCNSDCSYSASVNN